jgi:hypothetical protein
MMVNEPGKASLELRVQVQIPIEVDNVLRGFLRSSLLYNFWKVLSNQDGLSIQFFLRNNLTRVLDNRLLGFKITE